MTQRLDTIILFFLGILLFTWGLSSQEIVGFDSRFYLFALEMWRHGPTWFPTTYQHPYPDYPGTSTFFIYLTSRLFGDINKFTAVLPSAIASALTLSVTYSIGALFSRRLGWCAALFLLFTMAFVTEARSISLDQYVTLVTALCFYIVVKQANKAVTLRQVMILISLLIAGFAIRGPIGLVIPTGVMCVYYLLDKNIKQFFIVGFTAALVLVFCSAVLLALAYHVGGMNFVNDVLRMEVAGRMHDLHNPPITFYLTDSFGGYAITYPLMILMLPGCFMLFIRPKVSADVKFLQKCFAWMLLILVGLSIPGDKKIRYILPLAPALALICGYLIAYPERNRYLNYVYKLFRVFCFVFPVVALFVLVLLYQKHVQVNYVVLISLFIALQLGIVLLRKNVVATLGLAALTFVMANIFIVEAINLNLNQTRDFVMQVEALRQQHHAALAFYQEGSDGLPIKYLVNATDEIYPIYFDQESELLRLTTPAIVVVSEENSSHMSKQIKRYFHTMMKGKIGHKDVVVMGK